MNFVSRAGILLLCVAGAAIGSSRPAWGQASAAGERRVVDRAERLRGAGRVEEAAVVLSEYLEEAPAAAAALRLLGEVSVETGDVAAFLGYAEAAVDAAPRGGTVRSLWVEALLGASHRDSALAVAQRWVQRDEADPLANLALSGVYLADADSSSAIQALESSSAERSPELLARLADLLQATERREPLRSVWVELLALDPPRVDEVVEDLRASGARQSDLLSRLGDVLSERAGGLAMGPPMGLPMAGAVVALRLGQPGLARQMAGAVRPGEEAGAGLQEASFLREYVREAQEAGFPGEVAWAALELVRLSPRPADRLRWQTLAADQALAAGDTSAARGALVELRRESEPGAAPYGLASRRLFSLLAADPGSLEEAKELLDRYARLYPDSNHVEAAMRGELAIGYARAGQLGTGETVLAEGRRRLPAESIAGVEAAGARLALFAGRRDSVAARSLRGLSGGDLVAAERTRRLRLLTFVQTADSSEVTIVGAAAHALLMDPSAFDPGGSAQALAALPGTRSRPTALAFLAEEAEAAGRPEAALGFRRLVVDGYPRSPEAPAALLDLARASDDQESAVWLERLIVGYPESALAPLARRMLTRLQREGI